MSLEASFIQAILANPDDEAPLLIYSDWLEERGDARGEYLRLDYQLKRLPRRKEYLPLRERRKWLLENAIDFAWLIRIGKVPFGENVSGTVAGVTERFIYVSFLGVTGALDVAEEYWHGHGWSRPDGLCSVGQRFEVCLARINRTSGELILGRKNDSAPIWDVIDDFFPVGARVAGEVVNAMTYGLFVTLTPGLEGLVHIDEMSSFRPFEHPRQVADVGDTVQVEVVKLVPYKSEIWLRLIRRWPSG